MQIFSAECIAVMQPFWSRPTFLPFFAQAATPLDQAGGQAKGGKLGIRRPQTQFRRRLAAHLDRS